MIQRILQCKPYFSKARLTIFLQIHLQPYNFIIGLYATQRKAQINTYSGSFSSLAKNEGPSEVIKNIEKWTEYGIG